MFIALVVAFEGVVDGESLVPDDDASVGDTDGVGDGVGDTDGDGLGVGMGEGVGAGATSTGDDAGARIEIEGAEWLTQGKWPPSAGATKVGDEAGAGDVGRVEGRDTTAGITDGDGGAGDGVDPSGTATVDASAGSAAKAVAAPESVPPA